MSITLVRNNIMSRVERLQYKRYSKKRSKLICKIVFMGMMLIVTAISIYIVNYEVNKMLGNENKYTISDYIDIFY